MAGRLVGCPAPPMAAVGQDHNFPVPDRHARAVLGARGLHRAATGGQQVEAGQGWGQGSGRQRWGSAGLSG